MDIDINFLDLLGYIIMIYLLDWVLPRDYKEELGGIIGMIIGISLTIIWIIVFVWPIDLNISDIFVSL